MIRSLKIAALFSGTLMLGVLLGGAPQVARVHASVVSDPTATLPRGEAAQAPIDPKKKMPGDACKSSDECQKHHTCTKVGDKNVCQAPPMPPFRPAP